MGIISTGCATCRKRRIKCDEAKPGCKRCSKIGKTCPGYDRGLKLIFYTGHEQNGVRGISDTGDLTESHMRANSDPARNIPTRAPPKLNLTDITSHPRDRQVQKHSNNTTVSIQRPDLHNHPLQPSLSSDLEVRSVCLFISSFVHDSRPYEAFWDFLPDLYAKSPQKSCLRQTLTTVAQLNFINRYKASQELSTCVKQSYVNALVALNSSLGDPRQAISDETLASVWLLSMYELLVPGDFPQGPRNPWVNHVRGTMSLLRIRGKQQLTTQRGRQLFQLSHAPILAMLLMMGGKVPLEIAALNQAALESNNEDSSGQFLVSKYIQRAAMIRSSLREWVEKYSKKIPKPEDLSRLRQFLMESLEVELDGEFQNWAQAHPDWEPRKVRDDVLSTSSCPEFSKFFFLSPSLMFNWTTVWTTKMLLMQTTVNAAMLLQSFSGLNGNVLTLNADQDITMNIDTSIARIRENADNVLGAVSFAFGDIDVSGETAGFHAQLCSAYNMSAVGAYHLFWPVGCIRASPSTTLRQKDLGREALKIIGERFCIVQALKYTV